MGEFKDKNKNTLLNTDHILVYRGITNNVVYDANLSGFYSYKGYTAGAPTDWGGIVLTLRKPNSDIDQSSNDNSYFKLAFDRTGIYLLVLNADGTILKSWASLLQI